MTGKKYDETSNEEAAIIPFVVDDGGNAPEDTRAAIASTIKRTIVISVSVFLFFVVLGVVFILPKFVGQEPPKTALADDHVTSGND